MDIVFAGLGQVADRCRQVLDDLTQRINYEWIEFANPAKPFDLLLSVHWPEKFTKEMLEIPKLGALNLHNSYLPWNRGAHACTWAIVDQTPHGATLHWMNEKFDKGPIFHQERLTIHPDDTADTLYKRTADLEVKVFHEGMLRFLNGYRARIKQPGGGSSHSKKDFQRLVNALTTSDCKVTREA